MFHFLFLCAVLYFAFNFMYGQVSLEQSPYGQNVMIINSNYSVFQKEDGKS